MLTTCRDVGSQTAATAAAHNLEDFYESSERGRLQPWRKATAIFENMGNLRRAEYVAMLAFDHASRVRIILNASSRVMLIKAGRSSRGTTALYANR